jgi:hypothetical protein
MDHLAGTLGTENRGRRSGNVVWGRRFPGRFDCHRIVWMELLFDNGQQVALLGMEQSVGAHLLEATWEHVL